MTPTPPLMPRRAEKVGVAQIRIWQQAARSTAVLGSFIAADRLLKAWAARTGRTAECEFEIRYLDGSRLSGRYPMWQQASARQSLGAFVRRVLEQDDGNAAVLRFATGHRPDGFLEHYDVEDFAES